MRRDGQVTTTRPRYPRIAAAAGAAAVTLVAVLGATGVLPVDASLAQQPPGSGSASPAGSEKATSEKAALAGDETAPSAGPRVRSSAPPASGKSSSSDQDPAIPAHSGHGRRIVFDMAAQRVWLVQPAAKGGRERALRSYLVSGSVTDNLQPGSYAVYSKSMDTVGIDDSGTMHYFVRFAHGRNAAIGFHDIPVRQGTLVQGRDELGAPRSHGCIRQWRPDAKALWRFAPVGTEVVVV